MKKILLAGGLGILLGSGGALAADVTITMADMTYSPPAVSVSVGDTIRFVNDGTVDHNVFVPTAGFASDFGKQEPGSEAVMIVGKAGTFEIECVFHADMHAVVEVK